MMSNRLFILAIVSFVSCFTVIGQVPITKHNIVCYDKIVPKQIDSIQLIFDIDRVSYHNYYEVPKNQVDIMSVNASYYDLSVICHRFSKGGRFNTDTIIGTQYDIQKAIYDKELIDLYGKYLSTVRQELLNNYPPKIGSLQRFHIEMLVKRRESILNRCQNYFKQKYKRLQVYLRQLWRLPSSSTPQLPLTSKDPQTLSKPISLVTTQPTGSLPAQEQKTEGYHLPNTRKPTSPTTEQATSSLSNAMEQISAHH